jgi:hypothetical protein
VHSYRSAWRTILEPGTASQKQKCVVATEEVASAGGLSISESALRGAEGRNMLEPEVKITS